MSAFSLSKCLEGRAFVMLTSRNKDRTLFIIFFFLRTGLYFFFFGCLFYFYFLYLAKLIQLCKDRTLNSFISL